jgi:F420-non-reducing hydrogenase iron-sulfur subunit
MDGIITEKVIGGGKMSRAASTGDFEPEIAVLYCQYSVARNADLSLVEKKASGFKVRLFMLPCSSKVEVAHLLRILETGTDGIQVIGCPDRHCRFLIGNQRAEKRVEYARNLLSEIDIGAERIGMERGQGMEAEELLELSGIRAEQVRQLGPNPMKGRS